MSFHDGHLVVTATALVFSRNGNTQVQLPFAVDFAAIERTDDRVLIIAGNANHLVAVIFNS
jgi:hypothetical protein